MAVGKSFDRVGMAVASAPGTGTITLGAAITDATNGDLRTFAAAGAVNADLVEYLVIDGNAWELGQGTYSTTGPTLTRGVLSSSTGSALTLSGSAKVYSVPRVASTSMKLLRVTVLTAASGTWNKAPTDGGAPAAAYMFELIGGGAGGGSGANGTLAASRGGGGGGAGACVTQAWFSAADVASTCAYAIHQGGAGGASQTGSPANGNNGTDGGHSTITIGSNLTIRAAGANAGVGGSSASGGAGGAQIASNLTTQFPTCGGAGGALGGTGDTPASVGVTGPGGGGGGGGNSTATAFGGGAGAADARACYGAAVPTGASGGGAGGGAAGAGANQTFPRYGGGGGGGGSTGGAGTAGGAGGTPGGGGGGGGSGISGSGAGGAGGRGEIRIYEFG